MTPLAWTVMFGAGLAAACLLAINASPQLRRTAATLVAVWLACLGSKAITGRPDYWPALFAIDAAAALFILWPPKFGQALKRQLPGVWHMLSPVEPPTAPQAIIGYVYVVQLTFHVAYALVGSGPATRLYLDWLSGGGWLQIAVLAGGAIYGQGKRWRAGRGLGGIGAAVATPGNRRMAARERKGC
jgi:hypothetical protein